MPFGKVGDSVRDIVTVLVPPASTVTEVSDAVMSGPVIAGATETVYVTVEVETEVIVSVKLRAIWDDGSEPKLKLG